MPLSTVPLKGELYVTTCGVPVVDRVVANVVAVIDELRSVEELEEPDGHIPVDRANPSGRHWQFGMEPVSIFLCMVIPRPTC